MNPDTTPQSPKADKNDSQFPKTASGNQQPQKTGPGETSEPNTGRATGEEAEISDDVDDTDLGDENKKFADKNNQTTT